MVTKNLIGINCLDLKKNYHGGINTYVKGFLDGLIQNNLNKKFVIFCSNDNYEIFYKYQKNFEIFKLKYNRNLYYFCYTIVALVNSKKALLFLNKIFTNKTFDKIYKISKKLYTPSSVLSCFCYKGINIVSPHDFQHLHYKENFNIIRIKVRNILYRLTIKYSKAIQVSSNLIKKDLIQNFNINEKKILLIPEGVNILEFKHSFQKRSNNVIFPSYWWPHKNHKFIIENFKRIIEDKRIDCNLIMCGGLSNSIKKELLNLKLETKGRIVHLGIVSRKKLIKLYQSARLVLSTASYESNSLPILEALSCNTEVLASNIDSNLELGRKVKINYYKLNNSESFTKKLKSYWLDKKNINKNLYKEVHKNFSWKSISYKFYNEINKL